VFILRVIELGDTAVRVTARLYAKVSETSSTVVSAHIYEITIGVADN
jgi:hypothetical protein